jgi:alpha,alpha-trehalase
MKGLLQHTTANATSNVTTTADQRNYNLASELAQRYFDSAFCTWRSTGGAIPNVLPELPASSPDANGTIFEKYADNSTDVAGGGGEYAVVPGFGWSNGVLIWAGDVFSHELTAPACGHIQAANVTESLQRRWSLEDHEKEAFMRKWKR